MNDRDPAGGLIVAELRQQAQQLVAQLPGSVRRLRISCGDALLDIEWRPDRSIAGAPAVPAGGNGLAGGSGLAANGIPEDGRLLVVSPLVGTFYQAPEPGAAPFVQVGDQIEAGQVIGIVEAMKLMNQITADQPGRVAEVLVADGAPVEFEQPLIALVPD